MIKNESISFFAVIGFAVIAGLFVVFALFDNGKVSNVSTEPIQNIKASYSETQTNEDTSNIRGAANNQQTATSINFLGTTVIIPSYFSDIFSPFDGKKEGVAETRAETVKDFIDASKNGKENEPLLTENEVFHILYPDFYLGALKKSQDVLVEKGIITLEKKFDFKDEKEIEQFYDVLLARLAEKKLITEELYRAYQDGRALHFERPYSDKYKEAQEILAIQKQKASASSLWNGQGVAFVAAEAKNKKGQSAALIVGGGKVCSLSKDKTTSTVSTSATFLLKFLVGLPQEAHAQVECIREGASASSAGYDYIATCCQGCEDDGIPCLDYCPGPAIWDPTTTICGCSAL